jgi:hypothetical protein
MLHNKEDHVILLEEQILGGYNGCSLARIKKLITTELWWGNILEAITSDSNIKMELRKRGYKEQKQMKLAQNHVQWWALVLWN